MSHLPTTLQPDAVSDVSPVQPDAGGDVPQLHEPQAGWSVEAFHYYTADVGPGPVTDRGPPAHMYLARDNSPSRSPAGVQWWFGNHAPTPFHGVWALGRGTLLVLFNCRGPTHPDGSARRLKAARVRRTSNGTYYGEDQAGRRVKVQSYGKWLVEADGDMLVWVPIED